MPYYYMYCSHGYMKKYLNILLSGLHKILHACANPHMYCGSTSSYTLEIVKELYCCM